MLLRLILRWSPNRSIYPCISCLASKQLTNKCIMAERITSNLAVTGTERLNTIAGVHEDREWDGRDKAHEPVQTGGK
jgi:hypothetical protein